MPTITVKLDKKRAARLERWARHRKVPKSEVIRALIDRAGPIENDAWIVATADVLDADVVGADRPAFERLGARYLGFVDSERYLIASSRSTQSWPRPDVGGVYV